MSIYIIHATTNERHYVNNNNNNNLQRQVNILASHGDRPRGSSYLIAKLDKNVDPEIFEGTDNTIDGLELEETVEGQVKVVKTTTTSTSTSTDGNNNNTNTTNTFDNLHLNERDSIYTIDGIPITSISNARSAFINAVQQNHTCVPILTYNAFRRLKATVMSTRMLAGLSGGNYWDSKQQQMNIRDVYNVHEKVSEIERELIVVTKEREREEESTLGYN